MDEKDPPYFIVGPADGHKEIASGFFLVVEAVI